MVHNTTTLFTLHSSLTEGESLDLPVRKVLKKESWGKKRKEDQRRNCKISTDFKYESPK
jgi:hypothetical protein